MINTGQTIKLLRTIDGQGQGETAKKLGITRSYLCQVENGRKQPSLAFLKQIAQHYSVPLSLLVFVEQTVDENDAIFTELRDIFSKLLAFKVSRMKEQTDLD